MCKIISILNCLNGKTVSRCDCRSCVFGVQWFLGALQSRSRRRQSCQVAKETIKIRRDNRGGRGRVVFIIWVKEDGEARKKRKQKSGSLPAVPTHRLAVQLNLLFRLFASSHHHRACVSVLTSKLKATTLHISGVTQSKQQPLTPGSFYTPHVPPPPSLQGQVQLAWG